MGVLAGKIKLRKFGQNDDEFLCLGKQPLAKWLDERYDDKVMHVAVAFSPKRIPSLDQVLDLAAATAHGRIDASYRESAEGYDYYESRMEEADIVSVNSAVTPVDQRHSVYKQPEVLFDVIATFRQHLGEHGAILVQNSPIPLRPPAIIIQSLLDERKRTEERVRMLVADRGTVGRTNDSLRSTLKSTGEQLIKASGLGQDKLLAKRSLFRCPFGHDAQYDVFIVPTIPPSTVDPVDVEIVCQECHRHFTGKVYRSFYLMPGLGKMKEVNGEWEGDNFLFTMGEQ